MDILFQSGSDKACVTLPAETWKDLAMDEIVGRITSSPEEKGILRTIASQIPKNTEDIRFRQEIFKDLHNHPELRQALYDSLGMIRTLKDFSGARKAVSNKDNALYTLLQDLRSLSAYVETTHYLSEKLCAYDITSRGLLDLKEELVRITSAEDFEKAREDIKIMLEDLSTVKSAIIGVNFTPDLSISEISAVEFLPYQTRSKYRFAEVAASISMLTAYGQAAQHAGMAQFTSRKFEDPLLVNMAPKIEKHLKRHFTSLKQVLAKYTNLDSHFITEMYEGLTFYLSFAKYAETLKKNGYEICIPEVSETEGNVFEVKDFYNLRLANLEEKEIVKNDFSFSEEENIFILTGPNRGGKTILEQGLGIISLMASLGLFVTAKTCKGMPFQNILTHFPIDENLTINYGRLGEEAKRIHDIVKVVDNRSLVLFNETYSTTSSSDALYLSQDLIHILKEKGTAVIFNTHIHELGRTIDEMNAFEGKSRVVSLVMEIVDNQNTFRVKRSEPDCCSYARNIALKYGITYEQMKADADKSK
ncbi:MAG: hypothetical protein J5379_09940 [Clostridiales bacterium]|nr:hypothetical protein [Clostridiales bacterium]